MDPWLALGIFLLGAGSGALLTHIAQTALQQNKSSGAQGSGEGLSPGEQTDFASVRESPQFVIGDLFPHGKADMNYLRERATLVDEVNGGGVGNRNYKTKVRKKRGGQSAK